jgi:hypothetical protein
LLSLPLCFESISYKGYYFVIVAVAVVVVVVLLVEMGNVNFTMLSHLEFA